MKNKSYFPILWLTLFVGFMLSQGVRAAIDESGCEVVLLPSNLGYFSAPNEESPAKAFEIWSAAPRGAYVSVGTERGFIAAANTPAADALVLVDIDPGVNFFNRVNIALFRAAEDLNDYRYLRLEAGPREWRSRLARVVNPESRGILRSEGAWRWWRASLRYQPSWLSRHGLFQRGFATFHEHPEQSRRFSDTNYLWDPIQWSRLKRLVDADRVVVLSGNLADGEDFSRLVSRSLEGLRSRLSVLDVSNAWWRFYTPNQELALALQGLRSMGSDDSIFLITAISPIARRWIPESWATGTLVAWDYRGYTFRHVWGSDQGNPLPFVRSLRGGWFRSLSVPLVDGEASGGQ